MTKGFCPSNLKYPRILCPASFFAGDALSTASGIKDFEKKAQENNKGISSMVNERMSLNNSLGTGLSMMVDADLVFVNLNMMDLADMFKFPKISTSSRIGFLKLTCISKITIHLSAFSVFPLVTSGKVASAKSGLYIYSCLTSEEYDALKVSRGRISVEVKGLDVKHREYQCALAKSVSQPNAVRITDGNHYQTNSYVIQLIPSSVGENSKSVYYLTLAISINNPDKDTAKTQKINPKVKSNLMYKSCWQ
ncbi:hypothetical protein C8J56DRAFT_904193 [Mycena floridula]|nr:hypothetical protein C8J56DRAFT_904193 [Mycena floridula]